MSKQLRRVARNGIALQQRAAHALETLTKMAAEPRRERLRLNAQVKVQKRRSAWLGLVRARANYLKTA